MKKIIFILIITLLPISLFSQRDRLELGIRYLKLGNSHRVAKKYVEAQNFLKKGLDIARSERNPYWEAVAYEYYGYYNCDLGNKISALDYFTKAKHLYQDCIEKPLEGSHNTIDDIINFIKENDCPFQFEIPELKVNNELRANNMMSSGKVFSCDNCRLSQLPTNITLDATIISLENNQFTSIPVQLSQYESLNYLNMANNRIRDLTNVGNLTNLHYLNLSNNRIDEISDEIEKLSNLAELDLSNNRIKKVNTGIAKLKNLKVLDLRGNNIPFEELKRVIQALPNTMINHDDYKQEQE